MRYHRQNGERRAGDLGLNPERRRTCTSGASRGIGMYKGLSSSFQKERGKLGEFWVGEGRDPSIQGRV